MKIYLIGSLRNPRIPEIGSLLRAEGYDIFDDWHAAGPEADDYWQKYSTTRGQTYPQALASHAAQHIFQFDRVHLNSSDAGILVTPAGKSGYMELGYLAGRGCPTFILLEQVPERWDVMAAFATAVCPDLPTLIAYLAGVK